MMGKTCATLNMPNHPLWQPLKIQEATESTKLAGEHRGACCG